MSASKLLESVIKLVASECKVTFELYHMYVCMYVLCIIMCWRWDKSGSKSIDASSQKYHDIAMHQCMLKNIRGLNIQYDHYVNETDKIISSSIQIESYYHTIRTRVFFYKNVILKPLSITENILQITFYRSIHNNTLIYQCIYHQYLIYSIDTHIEKLSITVSSHLYIQQCSKCICKLLANCTS